MRRRVNNDITPTKGTSDRCKTEMSPGKTFKYASSNYLSGLVIGLCLLVFICILAGEKVVDKRIQLERPHLRELKLDASKQRVALPNLLLIEAGTFAVRSFFTIEHIQYIHIVTQNSTFNR
jgi:hypothetical protein